MGNMAEAFAPTRPAGHDAGDTDKSSEQPTDKAIASVRDALSWPVLLELRGGPQQDKTQKILSGFLSDAGLDVSSNLEHGFLTVRQSRRYAEVFASHLGNVHKKVAGQPARRPFMLGARQLYEHVDDLEFFLPKEAAYFTILHLESIKVDKEMQEALETFCRQRDVQRHAPLGGTLVKCLAALGLVVDLFPMHEAGRSDMLWKHTRFQLLPSASEYRNYLGDGVGFYVAWMNHYTIWLALPAVVGLGVASYHMQGASKGITVEDNPYVPLYAIMMVIWATCFNKFWNRTATRLQMEWHGELTLSDKEADLQKRAEPRSAFHGTLRTSPVTGKKELYYPTWKRVLRCLASWFVTSALLLIAFVAMVCSLNLQGYIERERGILYISFLARFAEDGQMFDPNGYLFFVPGICHAISIMTMNTLYRTVAMHLTEWENHSTEEGFESHLVVKRFFFEAFDCYVALMYLAFVEFDVNLVRAELISLYIADCVRRLVVEAGIPAVLQWIEARKSRPEALDKDRPGEKPELASAAVTNLLKPEYEAFDDYLEMVIQFGYIVMFAAAFPAAPLISALYTAIELKSDTFKLCALYRRPKPMSAHGIGIWAKVLMAQTWLAVFTNLAIVGYSSDQMAQWLPSWFQPIGQDDMGVVAGKGRLVVATLCGLEHILVGVMCLILFLVPDLSADVRVVAHRSWYHQHQLAQLEQAQALDAMATAAQGTG